MRKAIALFLLVFLPLQWGWAAAAAYCAHEAAGGAHFGHHDHAHAPDVAHAHPPDAAHAHPGADEAPLVEHAAAADPDVGSHADCGTCQLSSATAVLPWLSLLVHRTADVLPDSIGVRWPDAPPGSLYRPPLHARA